MDKEEIRKENPQFTLTECGKLDGEYWVDEIIFPMNFNSYCGSLAINSKSQYIVQLDFDFENPLASGEYFGFFKDKETALKFMWEKTVRYFHDRDCELKAIYKHIDYHRKNYGRDE